MKRLFTNLIFLVPAIFSIHAAEVEIDGIKYWTNVDVATAYVLMASSNGIKEANIRDSITIDSHTYTVTRISKYAFRDCSGLISIVIPNSVTNIEYGAFTGCSSLTSIVIPNSVTSLGEMVFRNGCRSLSSIKIPDSVTNIGRAAFYQCSDLTTIEIPNSMTSIEDFAFGYCSGLTSIEIPNSVTTIGQSAVGIRVLP